MHPARSAVDWDMLQKNRCFLRPHLSKGPSDLKQNETQEKKPFSGPVFHGLSCGVIRFVGSESSFFSCVPFCLRSVGPLERCVDSSLCIVSLVYSSVSYITWFKDQDA